ncbi:MAG: hypothetical protein AB1765_08625, partial [Candidatus Hydrogenedentota bacterium]
LWILYFGAVIGFDEYLYNIFLVPFKHRTVYEYSFLFHIKLGVEHLVGFISNLNLAEIYGFFRWTGNFIIFFVINMFVSIFISYNLLKKKTYNPVDLKLSVLSIIGILMCYPVESYWILISKYIVFILVFSYFFDKILLKSRFIFILIICFALFYSVPLISSQFIKICRGVYSDYKIVNERADFKLPPQKADELKKSIAIINKTVSNKKYYVVDSFTDMEMLYNLTYYNHKNYYIFLRRDCLTPQAISDLINRLKDYLFIIINQKDYDLYVSKDKDYLSGGPYLRTISEELMNYIVNNYLIIDQYNRPEELKDPFITDFYILKRRL